MNIQTIPGTAYCVTSTAGCTVADSNGNTLATVSAGEQKVFQATTLQTTVSDDAAIILPFDGASPSALGGGMSEEKILKAIQRVDTRVVDYGIITEPLDLSAYTIDTENRTAATDEIWFEFSDTAYEIAWPSNWCWLEGETPTCSKNTAYCICVRAERHGLLVANVAYNFTPTNPQS